MKGKIIKSGKSLISIVLVAMMVVSLFSMNVSAANIEKAQAAVSDTANTSSVTNDNDDSSSKQDGNSSSKVDKTRNKSTNLDSAGANVDLKSSGISNWYIYLYKSDGSTYIGSVNISGSSGNNSINLSQYTNQTIKIKVQAYENGRYGQKINNNGSITDGTEYTMTWQDSETGDMCSYIVPANTTTVNFSIWQNNGSNMFKAKATTSSASTGWYLSGYINGSDVTSVNNTYKFTRKSSTSAEYTLSYKATQTQYVTINDATNVYHPANDNSGTGTAADSSKTNTNFNGDPKWMVNASSGDTITYTWNSSTKTLSWVVTSDTTPTTPAPTDGYSIKIDNQSYNFNYNSNKNKYVATANITVPADAKDIPFEFTYKADSASDSVIYTAGGYWLAGQTTTTKAMSQADASTDKFYVGSPIVAGKAVTLYFTYDNDAKTLTASTVQSTNRLYVDLMFCGGFEKYLNCKNSNYATSFSVDNYLEAEITSTSGTETVNLNYDTANIFGTRKGIFVGNFPDSVFEASSIKFTLKNKSGTQLATYTTQLAPTKAGEIFTYDSNANNYCGWDSYDTYEIGSEKRKEATLKSLGINLADKGTVNAANPNGDKYGTSTYIFFDNSATEWDQLYFYAWGSGLGTNSEKRFPMTKLITNDEDRAFQIENYGHTVDVSDLWIFDVRDLFTGTDKEKEDSAKAWLKDSVFGTNPSQGFLFIDRGLHKTFPQHYSYSVDIGDWTINTYDPATKKNGTQDLKFSTTYTKEYYPCFLASRFLDCTQRGGGDELKYRAYTDGFYDLLQGHTTNNIRLASVTVYIDMHSTPSAVYMDILSTCHDEFNYADIIDSPLQRMGKSTVYSATFKLPFDYTTVESGLSQYASPMFTFDKITAGNGTSLTEYKLSSKAQPSGKCAKDDYGTGEVWLEATDLVLNGTNSNSKSLVSSSSTSADLVASSSPAKAKDIIASGADVELIESSAKRTFYLLPNSKWIQAGAKFVVWDGSNNVELNSVAGTDYYSGDIECGGTIYIKRVNPDNTNTIWDETSTTFPASGNNLFTLNDGWSNCGGTWSTYTPPVTSYSVKVSTSSAPTGGGAYISRYTDTNGSAQTSTTAQAVDIKSGTSVTFTAKAVDGYSVEWSGATGTTSGNTFTVSSVTSDITVTATYSKPVYQIACQKDMPSNYYDANPKSEMDFVSGTTYTKTLTLNANSTYGCFVVGNGSYFKKNYTDNTAVSGSHTLSTTLTDYGKNNFGNNAYRVTFKTGTSTSYTFTYNTSTKVLTITIATHTVTFNNNGHGTAPAAQTVEDGKTATKPTDPTATGYTFGGWYTDSACTTAYDFTTTVNANITLYAKWTANTYTVTFKANGGNASCSPETKTYTYGQPYGEFATATRTGYTFAGWYTAATGGTKVETTDTYSTADNTDLYAHWTAIEYNIETVCSNGTLTFTSGVTSGKAATDSTVKFKVTPIAGHRVDVVQYRMTSGGTSTTLTADASGVYSFTMPVGDVTITASIVPQTFTVTFDYAGGEESTESKYVTYGSTYGVLPTTTRKGYTFAGWFTAATGGTKVTADTTYTTAGDSTLYAHWTANKYTVTATAGANGTITNAGAKEYDYGTYAKFTATPASGYKISKWIVNGKEQSTTSDTLNYLVTDADNQTVEVQFAEQDKTVIYVGMVEYCFNNTSGNDSYIATPKYKIGNTTKSLPSLKTDSKYEKAYFKVDDAWGDPQLFYVMKVELSESDLASGNTITFYNGTTQWGSSQTITDGNYYLAYDYSGHKFISESPADLLHTFTVDSSITGGKVAVTGQDYKVNSTYYAKAATTLTATATATGEGYNFSSWNFSDGITKLTEEGTKATFNVTANDSMVSAVFTNDIKLIINTASYVTVTYNGVEYTDKQEFNITADASGTSYTIKFDIPDEENFCFDKFDITGSGTDAVITYVDNTKKKNATVTVTRGTSNIVITPVIRSNVDGVTVSAFDQGGTAVNAFDGNSTKVFLGHIGSSVKLTAPEVDGFEFVGWYTSDGKYLLSKNTSYTIEGEAFTGSMSVRAVYSNEQQFFGILSYSHFTYTLKSQNGTVENEPNISPVVKTTGGYTTADQNTGVITKNGDNDFTVVYADVDRETMPTFGETLSAQSEPNNESYRFSGWLENGVTVVSGGSTQTLAFVFGDTSNGTTAPFGEKTIVAVWVDALYDINMKYKYNAYDGKVAMEENYDLSGSGKDAPVIYRTASNIGLSTFLANLEEFAKDYAPIVNDVYYDYVFKYADYNIDSEASGDTNGKITYNAIADYSKTSAQKYSVVKGGNSEPFTIAYVKPDKVTHIDTDYGYYNWIAECTSDQAVMEDGSRYFLWYTYTDSGKVEVLLCSNKFNTYKLRLTSANSVKKVYLLVGEAGTAFNGKTLADYAYKENITINGNNVAYTNIDNQTYMHFRVDVNCPSEYTIEKMGVIFYYAADSVNTGTADKTLPADFDNTMESGAYKVTEAGLKEFANGATEAGVWVESTDNGAYGYAFDLTKKRNADDQVMLGIFANNADDYYCNYVFVGYVTYSYVNKDGAKVTDTLFTEFYNATIPTEYYNGGQKA